jgi:2-phospho-L-lactate guanylyltransferase
MKDPRSSKQRLSDVLAPKERECIAINLLHKTLHFLTRHFQQHTILIVTPSDFIAKIAADYKVDVLLEKSAKGLNAAIANATQYCIENEFSSQLVLPADIINLDLAEFTQLLNIPRTFGSVTICPSDDGGTNALISTPPNAIDFHYGIKSSEKHWRCAQQQQLFCQLITLPKLALDLDTAKDLARVDTINLRQLTNPITAFA